MRLIPKDWDKHQHYKDRKPQWIKLHRDLLNDFSYSLVRIGTKATLPLLWLLACEYEDGVIDATIEEISFRIHIDKNTVQTAIDELVEVGYFTLDSTLVQNGTEPYPREEKRRDREETEKEEKQKSFTFKLSKATQYENLSEKYINELYDYAKDANMVEAMRDYHSSNGKGFKDWSAAFRTWKRNDKKFNGSKPNHGTQSTIDKVFDKIESHDVIDVEVSV